MRKLFICLVIAVSPGFLFAQLNTFDLSSYKLPEIKRHQLDFNIDLKGSKYKYDRNYEISPDYYYNTSSLDGKIDLNYSFYKNSEKFQSSQSYGINFSPSFYDQKDKDDLLYESYDLNSSLFIFSENRFYYNSVGFFETDLIVDGGIWQSNQNSYPYKEENDQKNINVSIPIYSGFGRIEQVQDSRLAIYIFDELNKQGKLTRIPSQDEIIEFSELISKLKNERFFDSRLHKIHEIEEVDSFLQTKGLINGADSKYFTIVNDNWDYASTPIRESGHRISFGFEPELYIYQNNQIDEEYSNIEKSERNNNHYSLKANIKYEIEKPINLYWQSSFYFLAFGEYLIGKNESIYKEEDMTMTTKTEIESPQLSTSIKYSLGFYPNSRTDLSISLALNFLKAFGKETTNSLDNNINHMEIFPYSRINLNYYISPQFRLNVNYSINYRYIESDSHYYEHNYTDYLMYKSINQSINIGFIYKIF